MTSSKHINLPPVPPPLTSTWVISNAGCSRQLRDVGKTGSLGCLFSNPDPYMSDRSGYVLLLTITSSYLHVAPLFISYRPCPQTIPRMSLPKTYKALQQKEKGKPFELIEVEMKQPEKRQIVVKVLACGGTSWRPCIIRSIRFVAHSMVWVRLVLLSLSIGRHRQGRDHARPSPHPWPRGEFHIIFQPKWRLKRLSSFLVQIIGDVVAVGDGTVLFQLTCRDPGRGLILSHRAIFIVPCQ